MNKMRCNKKLFLAIGILFAVAVMFTVSPVSAAISYPPTQNVQVMGVPAATTGAPGVIIDNFEYWDSPQDHGWTLQHPGMPNGYPTWGVGVGVGTITNVIDFQQGSRVLEAYMPATVMVPNIQRFTISYQSSALSAYPLSDLCVFSVKMRSPVAVETFDTYEIAIFATDGAAQPANIQFNLVPRANTNGALVPEMVPENDAQLVSATGGTQVISVNVGRELADGSWHLIAVDLAKAYQAATGTALSAAQRVIGLQIIGNQYRMDDIMLVSCALNSRMGVAPYLFHINNLYQMLYDQAGTSRLIFACDQIGSTIYPKQCPDIVDASVLAGCGCPTGINPGTTDILASLSGKSMADVAAELWIANKIPGGELNAGGWSAAAAAVDLSNLNMNLTAAQYRAAVEDYETNVAGRTLGDMKLGINGGTVLSPSTPVTLNIGNGGAGVAIPLVDLYALDIPQLTNAQMAAGPTTFDNGINQILFTANVGGAHELGTCTDLLTPLPISTMPPYVPLYGSTSLMPCCSGAANGFLTGAELGSTQLALAAAGYSTWPAIAVLSVPAGYNQVAENIVLTVIASNGLAEDVEAFTLITTNYPVTNYPPVIEDVDDQIFYTNQPGSYQLNATDADSFTFSSAVQFADDMAQHTWSAYLNGLPNYQYGPWTESLINRQTGLVAFTPQFEGAYEMVVEVADQDGATAGAAFVIYCVTPGTWLNHPPVMLGDWDHPMIGTAGETLSLIFDGIVDPDGENLYYSCNIGSIGVRNGVPVWEFQTSYPGNYLVEIVAYDQNGGYLVIPQEVIISPWWSI